MAIHFRPAQKRRYAAVVAGAAAWQTKSVITYFLSRKIEAYKVELKRESDKEIEEVKSRLEIVALERQITFSRLHEKRMYFEPYGMVGYRMSDSLRSPQSSVYRNDQRAY